MAARSRDRAVPYRAEVADCVFCQIAAGQVPAQVVLADDLVVAFLDARPLFKGHVLVIPREHYPTLADLPPELTGPLFGQVRRVSAALPAALGAQGTFIALNNVVSQSVPHLHVHVVPRTRGDGLRGFFWPRQKYASEAEAAIYARRIAAALGAQAATPPGR
jgi:histidine triad (HIT) family protein